MTISVLKRAASDTKKLTMPHWPGLSIRSGAIAGGTGNVCAVVGPAMVVGYTVVHAGGVPSHAIAICDTPAGARTVVRSDDPAVLRRMMDEELCGREVDAAGAGFCLRGSGT